MLSTEEKKIMEVNNPEILCKDHIVKLLASLDGKTGLDFMDHSNTSWEVQLHLFKQQHYTNTNVISQKQLPISPLSSCEILTFPEPNTAS